MTNTKGNRVGKRLDVFLYESLQEKGYENFSRNFLQENWGNLIMVNENFPKSSYKLKLEDKVEIVWDNIKSLERQDKYNTEIVGQQGDLDILFEDENYLVIDKAKGVVVHPGVGHSENTLANIVKGYLEAKGEYDNRLKRSGLVHRLDKGVSGIIVFAKTLDAQKSLQEQFEKHRTKKIYLANVTYKELNSSIRELFLKENLDILEEINKLEENNFVFDNGWYRVEGYIGRSEKNRVKMTFKRYQNKSGKEAVSYIKPVSEDTVLIAIETGRMHQIRATLEYLGMNIKGDTLYKQSKGKGIPDEIELKSIYLSFYDLEDEYFSICKI